MFKIVLLLIAAAQTKAQNDHDGHDHGGGSIEGKPWEFIAVFDLHEVAEGTGKMSLVLSQVNGKYAEKSCNLLVLETTTADQAGIEAAEASAELLFKNSSKFIHVEGDSNVVFKVMPGTVHKLEMDTASKSTTFTLAGITEDSNHKANYAIFSEHLLR